MVWPMVIGAALGALVQSRSASKATDAQRDASAAALGEQRRQFDLTREDYAPYRNIGSKSLRQYWGEVQQPFNANSVLEDPGYQFGMDEGQKALDRKIAAMGGRVSGAALKAATRYGGDYATTRYGQAYQRGQDRLNRLAALAQVGQTATGGSAMAGMNAANQMSGIMQSQGDATAAGRLAQGSIWGNALTRLASTPWGTGTQQQTDTSFFRPDDPYRNPGYVGGEWGE